jgi:alkylation response protein AidB-like acyl-CoA dehydrogenase
MPTCHGSETSPIAPSKPIPDPSKAEHLLRLLTPVAKGVTAKKAIAGLAECMESLGGVGYLENEDMQFNITRLYRDTNALSI